MMDKQKIRVINGTLSVINGVITLQGTNISPKNGILKMIFLFPRWDMLIPWRVTPLSRVITYPSIIAISDITPFYLWNFGPSEVLLIRAWLHRPHRFGSTKCVWLNTYMGVSKNRGTPKWMVYNGKPYLNGWFGGTIIFGNTHIYLSIGITTYK